VAERRQAAPRKSATRPRPKSNRRSPARGRPSAPVRRRRRLALLAGILLLGGGAGLVLSELDFIEDTIREVTLPLRHDDIIRQQAADKGVDAELIAAVIYAESRFVDQTSEAGARGLMQITPETAREIERMSGGQTFRVSDLADPDINIAYGTFYLDHLLDRYGRNEVAAVAAYNAGQTRVDEWGGADLAVADIRFEETRAYVVEVLDKREQYRDHYADDLGLR
jgi:soluble lytic murein transglycosylase